MKICKYCKRLMKEEDGICAFCGYDPKTDTISPTFNQEAGLGKNLKQRAKDKGLGASRGINPGVKMFAFIGLAVAVFSLLYKHNFRISGVGSEITHFFSRLKTGKFTIGVFGNKEDKPAKTVKKAGLTDMGSFEAPQDAMVKKDLVVEGISFDPGYKSFVIINGKVLSEGGCLGSVVVRKINKDSVEVVIDGEGKVLGIHQNAPLPTKK